MKEGNVHLKKLSSDDWVATIPERPNDPAVTKSFGEYHLFHPNIHLYYVKAHTNTTLIYLTPESFNSLSEMYSAEFEVRTAGNEMKWLHKNKTNIVINAPQLMRAWVDEVEMPRIKSLVDELPEMGSPATGRRNTTDKKGRHFVSISQLSGLDAAMGEHEHDNKFKAMLHGAKIILKGTVVFHPDGNFQIFWNLAVLLSLIYNVYMVPFRISFLGKSDDVEMSGTSGQANATWLSLLFDYFGDVFFLMDMHLREKCFGFFEGDTAILDGAKIKARYLKNGRFNGKSLCDLLAIIPIELLAIVLFSSGLQVSERAKLLFPRMSY